MKASVINFLNITQQEMADHNVMVHLDKENTHVPLSDGMMCNGYFDDGDPPVFACALNKPIEQWFPIYVHEYGHFTQWRDQAPVWDGVTIDGIYYDDFLDRWLGKGENFKQSTIDQFIDACIAVESDCDRRVMQLIVEHSLPLDLAEYAQTANAYAHFYNYIKLHRKWYRPGKEPYRIVEVYSQFNTTIDEEFPVSYEYLDLFDRHCFS